MAAPQTPFSGAPRRRLVAKSFAIATLAPVLLAPRSLFAAEQLNGADELTTYWRMNDRAIALVMLSLPQCPVCEVVRTQQLLPLTRDKNYQDIGVFEIMMTNDSTVLPLAGKLNPGGQGLTPKSFARKLGIRLSPSLVFISRDYMLAEPLIGYPSPDYYWAYLTERIDAARKAISMTS